MKRHLPLIWRPEAETQLHAILDAFDLIDEAIAERFGSELEQMLEKLKLLPDMGRIPRDFVWEATGLANLREIFVWDYRLGYTLIRRHIDILYLAHSRRRFPLGER